MNKELQAIADAWDFGHAEHKAGGKRDEDKTRSLADKYVKAHPEQFKALAALGDESEDAVISALSVLRDEPDNSLRPTIKATMLGGDVDDDDAWFLLQVWLWHKFEPREIGGEYRGTVRQVH